MSTALAIIFGVLFVVVSVWGYEVRTERDRLESALKVEREKTDLEKAAEHYGLRWLRVSERLTDTDLSTSRDPVEVKKRAVRKTIEGVYDTLVKEAIEVVETDVPASPHVDLEARVLVATAPPGDPNDRSAAVPARKALEDINELRGLAKQS